MRVPVFKAKDRDSDEIVEGFYFNYPITNNMVPADGNVLANFAHCILTYKPGLMGIVNEPTGCTIDMSTLEFVKFVDVPCKTDSIIIS